MTETKRTLLAGFLVAFLYLCIPFYMQWVGVDPVENETDNINTNFNDSLAALQQHEEEGSQGSRFDKAIKTDGGALETRFYIKTNRTNILMSSVGGGSMQSYQNIESGPEFYKYIGGFND